MSRDRQLMKLADFCRDKRVRKMIRIILTDVKWLILFLAFSIKPVFSQTFILKKGVLLKSFSVTTDRHTLTKSDEQRKISGNDAPFEVKNVQRTVKNNRIYVNFQIVNNSKKNFKRLNCIIRLSSDVNISIEDKIAAIIPFQLGAGRARKIQASFTIPGGKSEDFFIGYIISEKQPVFSATNNRNSAPAGAHIRLNQTSLIINQ